MYIQGFAIHHRFNHWTEPSAVLLMNDLYPTMLCTNKLPECEKYVSPTGSQYTVFDQMEVTPSMNAVYIHQGDIHRQCSKEKQGKINAPHVKRQLVLPHTVGLAPYDVYANLTYAELSNEDVKITNVMKKSHYDLIMEGDFLDNESFYERPTDERVLLKDMRELMVRSVGEGRTEFFDLEPEEYWLNLFPKTKKRESNSVCVALNWCSVRDDRHSDYLIERLKRLRNVICPLYTITIRLHSFDQGVKEKFMKEGFQIEEEMSKWDSMDTYEVFIVDGTGYGLEASYRGWKDGVRVFNLRSLCQNQEFGGLEQMMVYPTRPLAAFISNPEIHSNYPEWLMDVAFPQHKFSDTSTGWNPQSFANLYAEGLMKIARG